MPVDFILFLAQVYLSLDICIKAETRSKHVAALLPNIIFFTGS
jgi:hypothetical protein